MARGIVPRQPAKTGRHEGARRMPKSGGTPGTTARTVKRRQTEVSAKKAALGQIKSARPTLAALKGYNPIAPERVNAILGHLDQLYPDVTCALHHRNAWELLVELPISVASRW